MAPGFRARQSPCNNLPANLTGEQDEFAGPQSQVKRSDIGSDKAFTPPKALITLKAPIPSLVPPTKDLFTKFMKASVESTQARDREQAELRE